METIVRDEVFGEMTYKRRWVKIESINIFDKEWEINIVAKAFSQKPISDNQREAYLWLKNNLSTINEDMYVIASNYINENCQQLATTWNGARLVRNKLDLSSIITPRTIMFNQDGTTIVLFDCPWDEHGIAIQLKPTLEIGSQDMFL